MGLKNEITLALKNAMKNNDNDSKRNIRLILANLKNVEIDKQIELDDNEIIAILHKEIKMRNETIEGAKRSNRQDIIDESLNDIKIISQFLPTGFSDDELRILIKNSINELGATSLKEMGAVMKLLLPKIAGKASNNQVSQLVKEYLQS
jgi:uncharacterized protein YqeY